MLKRIVGVRATPSLGGAFSVEWLILLADWAKQSQERNRKERRARRKKNETRARSLANERASVHLASPLAPGGRFEQKV